jgi:hypothetical protein
VGRACACVGRRPVLKIAARVCAISQVLVPVFVIVRARWTHWHLVSKARTPSGPAPFCHKWGAGFFYQLFYFDKSGDHHVVNVAADFCALCAERGYDMRFRHCESFTAASKFQLGARERHNVPLPRPAGPGLPCGQTGASPVLGSGGRLNILWRLRHNTGHSGSNRGVKIRRVELLRIELDHHVLSDRPSLMPLLSTSCITIWCASHQTLKVTLAMAAGVTDKLWEMSDMEKVLEAWEVAC